MTRRPLARALEAKGKGPYPRRKSGELAPGSVETTSRNVPRKLPPIPEAVALADHSAIGQDIAYLGAAGRPIYEILDRLHRQGPDTARRTVTTARDNFLLTLTTFP